MENMIRHISRRWQIPTNPEIVGWLSDWLTCRVSARCVCACVSVTVCALAVVYMCIYLSVCWCACMKYCIVEHLPLFTYQSSVYITSLSFTHTHALSLSSNRSSSLSRPFSLFCFFYCVHRTFSLYLSFRFYCTVTNSVFGSVSCRCCYCCLCLLFSSLFVLRARCIVLLLLVAAVAVSRFGSSRCVCARANECPYISVHTFFVRQCMTSLEAIFVSSKSVGIDN